MSFGSKRWNIQNKLNNNDKVLFSHPTGHKTPKDPQHTAAAAEVKLVPLLSFVLFQIRSSVLGSAPVPAQKVRPNNMRLWLN